MDPIPNCLDDEYVIDEKTERFVCTKCSPDDLTWEYQLNVS